MSMEGIDDSCEQSSSTTLKREKRQTSTVWDSFVKVVEPSIYSDGKIKVKCTLCEKTIYTILNLEHRI